MPKIAIVAAMEREVSPLLRNWKLKNIKHSGRRYRLFENGEAVLICGGIGFEAARRATEAVIGEVDPARVISIGFAGALEASLRVGDVFTPRAVINAADGVRTEVESGCGVLVSSANVVGKQQKARFAKAYDAIAVDMEAAAVAQGALARGIEFGVVKVISDSSDFDMPAVDRFVASDGTFQSVRFACHVALRPWLWGTTFALARNSSKASHALCGALVSYLERETRAGTSLSHEPSISNSPVDEFDSTNREEFAGAHTVTGIRPHNQVTGK
jgi:adenosylhomocysteine nucleosidase